MVGPRTVDEDELEELPPLDGDSREQPEGEPNYSDLLEESAEGEASLDDSTAEDEPPDTSELDLEGAEGGWIGEANDSDDLDIGEAIVDWSEAASPLEDLEEAGVGGEDFDLHGGPERGGLDPGEEGPVDPDEELKEGDLPEMDADDEGEMQDSALIDPAFASDEPLGLSWAAQPWTRVGAPVPIVRATAVACAARGAIVVGRSDAGAFELASIDLEGACERLPAVGLAAGEVRSLAVDGHSVVAVLADGRLMASTDGGRRFGAIRDAASDAVPAAGAVFASGRLWVRTRAGGVLVVREDAPEPLERCAIPGVAAALVADAANGGSVALEVDGAQRPIALVRGSGGGDVRRAAIDGPPAGLPAVFAARGDRIAYGGRGRGALVRAAAGVFKAFEWEGTITALAFVDDVGTLVASTYSDSDDTSALVRLDAAGSASIVGRIGGARSDPEADGRVVALAYDEARGVVWVAGGFGVAAFAAK